MPVSRARQKNYPGGSLRSPEWLEIRRQVLARDGNACQTCRVQNRSTVMRGAGADSGTFMYWDRPVFSGTDMPFIDVGVYDENTGDQVDVKLEGEFNWPKTTLIVLTIAHLDHDPTNNDLSNLAALCQLHHNRHDAKHRAATRRMRKNGDLFLDVRAV